MLKESTYKEKFSLLKNWIPTLIESVKKDLKNEHLKKDPVFLKKYFSNKNLGKLTTEELVEGYQRALVEDEIAEHIAEFISNRWLMNHGDVYHYFEEQLRQINPEFQEIESIEQQKAQHIMEGAMRQFGAPETYLFAVINSVAFPEVIYTQLSKHADEEAKSNTIKAEEALNHQKSELTQRAFEEQIARLTDKFEKKLLGLQKKYQLDMEGMKKQVAILQRKLNDK